MSWLLNCSECDALSGVSSPKEFSRLYGCSLYNLDIFGETPERDERSNKEFDASERKVVIYAKK